LPSGVVNNKWSLCWNVLIKNLIIYTTYPAREEFDEEGSAFSLYHNLKGKNNGKVVYANSEKELILKIKGFYNFSNLLILGAGDIYDTAKKIIRLKTFKK
jgi:UDP-N-acetylmuramate-alanine ligase